MSAPPPSKKRRWLPILFSAAVYPGAGQLIQGRWLAGLIFVCSFSAAFLWLGWLTLYPAFHNLQTALDGMRDEFMLPDWPNILTSLGLSIVVYGVSLTDTVWAERKTKRTRNPPNSSNLPGVQD